MERLYYNYCTIILKHLTLKYHTEKYCSMTSRFTLMGKHYNLLTNCKTSALIFTSVRSSGPGSGRVRSRAAGGRVRGPGGSALLRGPILAADWASATTQPAPSIWTRRAITDDGCVVARAGRTDRPASSKTHTVLLSDPSCAQGRTEAGAGLDTRRLVVRAVLSARSRHATRCVGNAMRKREWGQSPDSMVLSVAGECGTEYLYLDSSVDSFLPAYWLG